MLTPLEEYLDFAVETAHAAGRLTLGYFQTGLQAEYKGDDSPVTIADRQAETLIRDRIEKRYLCRDGGMLWCSLTVSALLDEQGNVLLVDVHDGDSLAAIDPADAGVIGALGGALSDKEYGVRVSAAESLGECGVKAAAAVRGQVADVLAARWGCDAGDLAFAEGRVTASGGPLPVTAR